jgi:hypothetical protein
VSIVPADKSDRLLAASASVISGLNASADGGAGVLACPTKCYLQSIGELGSGNTYATWDQAQNESYRAAVQNLKTERGSNLLFPHSGVSVHCAIFP